MATTTLTTQLAHAFGAGRALALSAATVATLACVVGLIASRFITEPESDALPL